MAKSIPKKKRISIREYQPEDRERVINLLNAPSIKPDIWKWQFDKRYFSSNIKPIVAEDNWGNILGFNGMMPVKLHTQEFGELEAAWSCDFFVSRHCRGLGVGKEIKRELKKQSPITFALGTSPTAAAVLEKSGWLKYSNVYNYSGRNLKPKVERMSSFDESTRHETSDSGELPSAHAINKLWERLKHNHNAAIVRDASYFNWRYKESPIAKYQFVFLLDANSDLEFLAVYTEHDREITLVDYLGAKSLKTHEAILQTLASKCSNIKGMTSCPTWDESFSRFGLNKSANPVNCFVYSENPEIAHSIVKDFFLMPGDCDGDILNSSVTQARELDQSEIAKYQIEKLSYEEFLKVEAEWDKLVLESEYPSIFSSWMWVKTWWEYFAKANHFELQLLICKIGGVLVGIAPMYLRKYRLFLLPVRQLQLIGCSWSGPNTFRSEYLDLIIHKTHARNARLSLLDALFSRVEFDELILGDIPHQSLTTRLLEECFRSKQLYTRTVHEDHSVIIDTEQKSSDYIARLSNNFRRATIHKFEQLKLRFDCAYTEYEDSKDCPFNIIDTLNALHLPRWGKPCFEGLYRDFHESLIKQASTQNTLNVATLKIDGETKALTYNLAFANTIYNIQLGYDDTKPKGFSLGLIHLMHNVLTSNENRSIKGFDLLAGYGKSEYYKERFGGRIQNLSTKQYLKGKWIKLIYRIYDKKQALYKRV